MNRRRLLLLVAIVGIAGAFAFWKWLDRVAPETPSPTQVHEGVVASFPEHSEPEKTTEKAEKAETEEEKARRLVLGVWQDEYKGKRTMTLNDDGTGTMRVELSGAEAFLFAPELLFRMEWSLDGKKLKKKTVSGEPAAKVNLILKTMGDTAEDTILESTDAQLLLLDKDGKTKYDWRRLQEKEEGEANGN